MREEWSFAAWALCRNLGCRQDRTGVRLTLRQWRHCPHLTCCGYKACMWASWVPITDISGLHVSDFLHGVPCWTPVRWQQPGVKVTDLTGQIPADMELHLLAVACLLFGRIMMTHQTVHSMCYYSFFFFFYNSIHTCPDCHHVSGTEGDMPGVRRLFDARHWHLDLL